MLPCTIPGQSIVILIERPCFDTEIDTRYEVVTTKVVTWSHGLLATGKKLKSQIRN